MKSLETLAVFLNENIASIILIIGCVWGAYLKVKLYFSKSKKERTDIAIKLASETILEKITEAEIEWQDYKKSGSIKRSEVLRLVFEKYPILQESNDIDNIIEKIDNIIDEGLKEMKKILENTDQETKK